MYMIFFSGKRKEGVLAAFGTYAGRSLGSSSFDDLVVFLLSSRYRGDEGRGVIGERLRLCSY